MTDICEKTPKSRFIGFINSAYGDLDKFDVASCYARVKRNSGVLHVLLLNIEYIYYQTTFLIKIFLYLKV